MPMFDFQNTILGGTSVAPISLSAGTTNGSSVDMLDAIYPYSLFASVGVSNIATSITVKFQETTEDPANLGNPLASGWGDVTNGSGTLPVAGAGDLKLLVKTQAKRFIRAVFVIVGGGSAVVQAAAFAQRRNTNPGTGASISPQV